MVPVATRATTNICITNVSATLRAVLLLEFAATKTVPLLANVNSCKVSGKASRRSTIDWDTPRAVTTKLALGRAL
eukprot:9345410-Karenia_brevis.AAC.1